MDVFPEHAQKEVWRKLMGVFEADRPYSLRNVQKLKDKFREWDVYKVKMVEEKMREGYLHR